MLTINWVFLIWFCIACGSNKIIPNASASKLTTDSDYRLPTSVIPLEYNIQLTISLNENDTSLPGKVTIKLNVTEDNVKEIRLHGSEIEFINYTLLSSDLTEIEIIKIDYDTKAKEEIVIIELAKELTGKTIYDLTINYNFQVSTDMNGFYKSTYEENGENTTIGVTQFEPTYARRVFPCFDEPSFKAKFILSLEHGSEYTAVRSNFYGTTEPIGDGSVAITRFDETEKMSSYLVAFIVTSFSSKTSVTSNKIEAFAPKSVIAHNQTDYILTLAPSALRFMTDYTQQLFDYKMDLVVIPDFAAGAMENWGLVTSRHEDFVYDPKESTSRSKQNVATVLTHEISHMWFGNLVTLDWWDNLWLNEGFATYFEYFGTQNIVDASWCLNDQFVTNVLQQAIEIDALETAFAVRTTVSTPDQINNAFSIAAYQKAAAIIRMVELTIGSSTFQKGLQLYQKNYRFENVNSQDLYYCLQSQIHKDGINLNITALMEPFISQSGVPVITVENTKSGTLTISQKRFYFKEPDTTSNTYWEIPLTYASQDQKDFTDTTPKLYLEASNKNIQFGVSNSDTFWIVFNVQSAGYYRVNYDSKLLKNIKTALMSSSFSGIPEINRGQLVDDILNLARGGMVKYDTALDFITFMANDTEYTPWASTLNAIYFISIRMQQNATNLEYLNNFMRDQIATVYNKYQLKNLQSLSASSHIQKLTQSMILNAACFFRNSDCIKQATSMFQQWKSNPNKKVYPADIRNVVYCTGIKNGTSSDWDFLWSQFSSNSLDKRIILRALGCSEDTAILNKYLSYSLDPTKIRAQDAHFIFEFVYSGSPNGVEVALAFLENNVNDIAVKYGGLNSVGRCIMGLANYLTTQDEVNRLTAFIDKNKNTIGPIEVIADNAIDIAETGLQWNIDYENDVINYFLKQNSGSLQNTITLMTVFLLCFWSFVL